MNQMPHCIVCGSERIRRKSVTVVLQDGRRIVGVPAEVCLNCGEQYFDSAAADRVLASRAAPKTARARRVAT
jgi:YgiT-type zinc finger domain-containing protein